jgi:hypothetical protein
MIVDVEPSVYAGIHKEKHHISIQYSPEMKADVAIVYIGSADAALPSGPAELVPSASCNCKAFAARSQHVRVGTSPLAFTFPCVPHCTLPTVVLLVGHESGKVQDGELTHRWWAYCYNVSCSIDRRRGCAGDVIEVGVGWAEASNLVFEGKAIACATHGAFSRACSQCHHFRPLHIYVTAPPTLLGSLCFNA